MVTRPLRRKLKKRKVKGIAYNEVLWGYLFLLPNIFGVFSFIFFPLVIALGLSFFKWDILTPSIFLGLKNYIKIFQDITFLKVFRNTIYYVAGTVPLGIFIALIFAVALNRASRLIKLYRAIYFLPVVCSMIAVAIVWQWIYNPEFGFLNFVLSFIGIKGPKWLSSTQWAMPALIIVSIWKGLGFNIVIFLAGLQGIPDVYYEAARIDGASTWNQFWRITLPLLSSTTFFITVISVISSFQIFDQVFIMTDGGPARSTSVIVHYLYQNAFLYFKMGYASAMGCILFAAILSVTLIQVWRAKTWVHYGI